MTEVVVEGTLIATNATNEKPTQIDWIQEGSFEEKRPDSTTNSTLV